MLLTTKRKFLFSSNYITPEFLQLSFGLREDWGTEQVVFDSGSPQIDVYVYTEWTDAYRDGAKIMSACMQGRLRPTLTIRSFKRHFLPASSPGGSTLNSPPSTLIYGYPH